MMMQSMMDNRIAKEGEFGSGSEIFIEPKYFSNIEILCMFYAITSLFCNL